MAKIGDPREEVTSISGMQVCWVPAGDFYEEGKKQQALPYCDWISRYPVTQAQFAEFAEASGYREERFWAEARKAGVWEPGQVTDLLDAVSVDGPKDFGEPFSLPNHPVVGVTWYEALAFSRWLTERLREEGLPEPWEVRVPSEGEWEKAARGGLQLPSDQLLRPLSHIATTSATAEDHEAVLTSNSDARCTYPWGDEIDPENANYDETGIGATSAAGCFPEGASPYGCEEMSGNVWEWCRDVRKGEATDPQAVVALRGGSWVLPAQGLAAAFRLWVGAGDRYQGVGFRVVLLSVSEHA